MRSLNRLINDFRYQTNLTIWKHMNAMAVNYAVYSNRIKGFAPYLYNCDIYADSMNMVVVCVDSNKHRQKQYYEETQNIDMMIYEPGCEPRESTVWKLKETMEIMKSRLRKSQASLNVYGILLTEDVINNAYELEDDWEKNDIKVISNCSQLKLRRAGVNDDDDLAGKVYFDIVTDESIDAKPEPKVETADEDYDEFEQMLFDFVNNQFDEEPDGIMGSSIRDNTTEDEEETNEEEPEPETPEEPETPTTKSETIDQNMGLSVDVKILPPIDNPREELDKLVGCEDIKHRMDELVALTSYNRTMQEMFPNSKQHEVSLHSVFLGRPGTGKTTVCKIFGSLLHDAGALSKGHVVVCDRGTFIGTTAEAFFVAAIPEEFFKLLALWIVLRKNPYFDEHFDGIVYAVCIGLGFAAVENISYVFSTEDWVTVALTRSLLAVPGHYAFAVLMGYYYSIYHFVNHSPKIAVCTLLAPVLAHGIYDALAMSGMANPYIGGIGYVVLIYFCIKMHKRAHAKILTLVEKDRM